MTPHIIQTLCASYQNVNSSNNINYVKKKKNKNNRRNNKNKLINTVNNENKVINNSIKSKLIDSILNLIYNKGYILFGGAVRDYIIPKNKLYPTDIDIGVDNITTALKDLSTELQFCFDVKIDKLMVHGVNHHTKMQLTYKFLNSINFCIDISNKKIIGSNLDFNVNGIYMTNERTYHLVSVLPAKSLCEIIDKINQKKFQIIKTYKRPQLSRSKSGIEISSKNLVEYIKMMDRTSKMLNRDWKLDKQNLDDIFEPNLIKLIDINNVEGPNKTCVICSNYFKKYELQLDCCKTNMCFNCTLKHIKSRYNNSEISCPFCRGDPFGWKTIKIDGLIESSGNDFNSEIEYDYEENAIEHSITEIEDDLIYDDDDVSFLF